LVATSRIYFETAASGASSGFGVDLVSIGHYPQMVHFQEFAVSHLAVDFIHEEFILNFAAMRETFPE
jgi:hypothetical protein